MKTRKTFTNQRQTYTYHFDNGDKVIIEPGKSTTIYASGGSTVVIDETITDVTIKRLHLNDDAEVRANLKYINCEDEKNRRKRIENKKQWAMDHPEQPQELNPYNHPERILSLDFFGSNCDEDSDKSRLQYQIAKEADSDNWLKEKTVEVRDFVATLPETMQQTYDLIFIKGYKQCEMCKMLGLTKGTVSERVKTLEKKIKEKFC